MATVSGATDKSVKKDVIGCEPNRLSFRMYDDKYCKKPTKGGASLTTQQITDMTRDKCIPFTVKNDKYYFKGKCDFVDDKKLKLNELEVKYYRDKDCKDKDTSTKFIPSKY